MRKKLKENNLNQDKKESYLRLSKISFIRKILKKAIMNVPYNVTIPTMLEYMQENFDYCDTNVSDNISNYQEY